MLEALYIMIYRQLKEFIRARSRIIGAILNNVLWLVFFGLGLSPVFRRTPPALGSFKGIDFLTFLLPGVFIMTIFQVSFMAGISVIWIDSLGSSRLCL